MWEKEFPYFNFFFEVELKGEKIRVHEVSGFGVKYTVKETENADAQGRKTKSIDKSEYDNLTITKGIYYDDPASWRTLREDAFKEMDTQRHFELLKIETVYIRLLLTTGEQVMSWTLANAFPVNWKISDFNANESGIATETIEFAFDTLSFWNE